MIHQDGNTHEWVAEQQWDRIVTSDDVTNAHYSMFFVKEKGTSSRLRDVREVIESGDSSRVLEPTGEATVDMRRKPVSARSACSAPSRSACRTNWR